MLPTLLRSHRPLGHHPACPSSLTTLSRISRTCLHPSTPTASMPSSRDAWHAALAHQHRARGRRRPASATVRLGSSCSSWWFRSSSGSAPSSLAGVGRRGPGGARHHVVGHGDAGVDAGEGGGVDEGREERAVLREHVERDGDGAVREEVRVQAWRRARWRWLTGARGCVLRWGAGGLIVVSVHPRDGANGLGKGELDLSPRPRRLRSTELKPATTTVTAYLGRAGTLAAGAAARRAPARSGAPARWARHHAHDLGVAHLEVAGAVGGGLRSDLGVHAAQLVPPPPVDAQQRRGCRPMSSGMVRGGCWGGGVRQREWVEGWPHSSCVGGRKGRGCGTQAGLVVGLLYRGDARGLFRGWFGRRLIA